MQDNNSENLFLLYGRVSEKHYHYFDDCLDVWSVWLVLDDIE